LGHLVQSLQLPDFVGGVLHDHVALLVLELPQTGHQQVANSDPDFLSHLSSDVPDPFDLIEAFDEYSSVA
jgi:hypothetical protein